MGKMGGENERVCGCMEGWMYDDLKGGGGDDEGLMRSWTSCCGNLSAISHVSGK